jgi:hypothetical protein
VYVVAEGRGGFRKRVAAWLQEHGLASVDGAFCILEPVQLLDEDDITLLLIRLSRLRPKVVILDTFASCFNGDENAPRDMSNAIAAARRIIRETGATVILVHHTGKKGDEARGHSALRAAADTMILLKAKRGADGITPVSITNPKQKEDEPFSEILLRLKRVSIGTSDAGDSPTSCAVELADRRSILPDVLNAGRRLALAVLVERHPEGAPTTAWMTAIAESTGIELAPRTFHNHRKTLQGRRLVDAMDGKPTRYRPTEAGRSLVSTSLSGAVRSDVVDLTSVNGPDVPVPEVCQSMPNGTGATECQPPAPLKGAVALAEAPNSDGDRADG